METCNLFKAYIRTTSYSFKKGFPIYITTHFHRFYPTSLKNYESELSLQVDWVAEWLRRWTANPMGFARVGSNPISVVNTFGLISSFMPSQHKLGMISTLQ